MLPEPLLAEPISQVRRALEAAGAGARREAAEDWLKIAKNEQ
jgi:predicted YcjX-like family ATPase